MFPLKSIEAIKDIEENLQNDEYNIKITNFKRSVGGTSLQNFIKRVLARLFTNKLSSVCSWTGFMNNFRLDNLKIMMILKQIAFENYQMNDSSFECLIKDWFRHGSQRLAREVNTNQ